MASVQKWPSGKCSGYISQWMKRCSSIIQESYQLVDEKTWAQMGFMTACRTRQLRTKALCTSVVPVSNDLYSFQNPKWCRGVLLRSLNHQHSLGTGVKCVVHVSGMCWNHCSSLLRQWVGDYTVCSAFWGWDTSSRGCLNTSGDWYALIVHVMEVCSARLNFAAVSWAKYSSARWWGRNDEPHVKSVGWCCVISISRRRERNQLVVKLMDCVWI